MGRKISCTNEPIGGPKVVRDFLPSPQELVFRREDVTITLSKKSVEFFKEVASGGGTQYQRMICRLLDAYVDAHAGAADALGQDSRRQMNPPGCPKFTSVAPTDPVRTARTAIRQIYRSALMPCASR